MDPTIYSNRTRRQGVLAAVCIAALALPLAFSGGALATPAISRDLHASPDAVYWITNAFMLAFGSLLMAAGALADRFGRKRVFTLGVAGFTLASATLGLAPSIVVLNLLRAAQGVAAAAALAGGAAALAQEFDGSARTRAFSTLGATFGVGLAFGPIIAGWLIAFLSWHAIFMTGAFAGILSLSLAVPQMQESCDPHARRLDWPGIVTFTAALACFTCGLIEAPTHGWTSVTTATLLVACMAFAIAFVVVETRSSRPMLDLSLFRYPRFIGVQVLPVATCYCYIVLLVVLPLRFIGMDGYDEVHASYLMLALSSPMLFVPFVAAALTRWLSAGIISGIGLVIAGAGLHALAGALRAGAGSAAIGPMLAIGIGAGLPWGLMDGLSVSMVPKSRAGMATGIFSTTRVAGECVALATVNALLAVLTQFSLRAAVPLANSTNVAEAAARLSAGDLAHATAKLPHISPVTLQASYHEAFGHLLDGLTAITLLCALAVFAFLSRVRAYDEASGTDAAPLSCDLPMVDRKSQLTESVGGER
ncbi:MFS transporter [Paraburkholderia acidisoli]|uniref:MFS transporter n=1 Tax=Paraburkholderia acidisoli TaxID=2571748 RepID=A0A7Z2GH84_9BURK|nr:MFS transporter [Paraburkholderia acidisoli]QGZ61771.1 MFS transporter [Paraburkholderia acidisoli]